MILEEKHAIHVQFFHQEKLSKIISIPGQTPESRDKKEDYEDELAWHRGQRTMARYAYTEDRVPGNGSASYWRRESVALNAVDDRGLRLFGSRG